MQGCLHVLISQAGLRPEDASDHLLHHDHQPDRGRAGGKALRDLPKFNRGEDPRYNLLPACRSQPIAYWPRKHPFEVYDSVREEHLAFSVHTLAIR